MSAKLRIASPELLPFYSKNGLFDASDRELEQNIGRKCRFLNPTCTVENEIFTIIHLQKNWHGRVIYRGLCESDTHNFGRSISPEQIEFIN
jgi:hypothetical protein